MSEIVSLAEELGIAPGIVAGRYQFLTGKWSYFKDLIRKLEWAA
jgi:HTH-type transcriptional regulator / antitoxin HigA